MLGRPGFPGAGAGRHLALRPHRRPGRQALALKQITFYAGELKQKNPYRVEENKDAVERGRVYLSSFGGVERLTAGIIEEANKNPHARAPGRSFSELQAGP
jgi:hypothetical protein